MKNEESFHSSPEIGPNPNVCMLNKNQDVSVGL